MDFSVFIGINELAEVLGFASLVAQRREPVRPGQENIIK